MTVPLVSELKESISSEDGQFEISEDWARLDLALKDRFAGVSRGEIQNLITSGLVKIDGNVVTKPAATVACGAHVEIVVPATHNDSYSISKTPKLPPVLYGDEHLLVIDKPAGLVVHSGNKNRNHTLVDALKIVHPSISAVGERDRPGIVHRLDKDTSGVMLVALSELAYKALSAAIKARQIKRIYQGLVSGRPEYPKGLIDAPLGRSKTDPTRRIATPDGKPARTHYRVLNYYRGFTLLEFRLDTGRTHQIRVHCATIKTPIAGDLKYGGVSELTERFSLRRQFLHATILELEHPVTKKRIRVESPIPNELQSVIQQLEPLGGETRNV